MRTLIVSAIVALVLVPFAGARNWKATLTVDPDPPVLNQPNTLSGCGYVPSEFLKIYVVANVDDPKNVVGYDFNISTDASGCFVTTWTPTVADVYGIWAYQPNNPGKVLTARSHIEFTVED